MPTVTFALDRSGRRLDADGRLHVERSHISKASVNPYYGKEIPGYQALGLDPDKIYRLLRDPVELERAAPTFARLPILKAHVPLTVANVAEDEDLKKLIVGAIGSNVIFSAPYLDADICVWDAAAIAGIDTDTVRELSCGYRYVPVMEPGEFDGEPYDGRMTEIRGNHLALVEVGRAGSDVVVADRNPFTFKETAMKMSKLGKALFAALCAASPVLAADSALPALVGNANRKNLDRKELKEKILALDSDMNPETVDNVVDSLLDVQEDPKPQATPAAAADESPADKLRKLLAGKVDDETLNAACALLPAPAAAAAAADAEEGAAKPEDVKAAMDSMRKELREAAEAAREVRAIVGDVAMDSAAEIYGFALDHMKVDHKGVEGAASLRALFRVANKTPAAATVVAQDSAGLAARFPAAARFRNA
jgi:hypothetical protein